MVAAVFACLSSLVAIPDQINSVAVFQRNSLYLYSFANRSWIKRLICKATPDLTRESWGTCSSDKRHFAIVSIVGGRSEIEIFGAGIQARHFTCQGQTEIEALEWNGRILTIWCQAFEKGVDEADFRIDLNSEDSSDIGIYQRIDGAKPHYNALNSLGKVLTKTWGLKYNLVADSAFVGLWNTDRPSAATAVSKDGAIAAFWGHHQDNIHEGYFVFGNSWIRGPFALPAEITFERQISVVRGCLALSAEIHPINGRLHSMAYLFAYGASDSDHMPVSRIEDAIVLPEQ